jgi:hypothetical protein
MIGGFDAAGVQIPWLNWPLMFYNLVRIKNDPPI